MPVNRKLKKGEVVYFIENDLIRKAEVREQTPVGVYLCGMVESLGPHAVHLTYEEAIKDRANTSKNPIHNVVRWLNYAVEADPTFIQNLTQVSLISYNTWFINDSPFQFSGNGRQAKASILGMLNGCFGDMVIIATTEEDKTITKFTSGVLGDDGVPIMETEP